MLLSLRYIRTIICFTLIVFYVRDCVLRYFAHDTTAS